MIINEKFFDRFDQTFKVLKNNFVPLFLPIFIYNFIAIIIGIFSSTLFLSNIGGVLKGDEVDYFSLLNNSYIVTSIAIGMVLLIIYLLLYIPIFLGLLKSIKNAVNGDSIDMKSNLLYGFRNITNSFKTYWYIFSYIALIPSIIFILGGLLFNFGYFLDGPDIFKQAGGVLMVIASIIFIIFAIYRGLKSTFSMYSAVNDNKYTKENFNSTLNITKNKLRRIIGNLLLLGLIISTISSIIGGLISTLYVLGNGSLISIIQSIDINNIDSVKNAIQTYIDNQSTAGNLLSGIIDNIITTTGGVFSIIFTYILYLRLKEESDNLKSLNKKNNILSINTEDNNNSINLDNEIKKIENKI